MFFFFFFFYPIKWEQTRLFRPEEGLSPLYSVHVEIKVSARHWQRQTLVVNQNSFTQLCAVWAHSLFVLFLHIYGVCVCKYALERM
jgi:hypothetical protein